MTSEQAEARPLDEFVTRESIRTLYVRADLAGNGPATAFRELEARLTTLRGRRFYAAVRSLPTGVQYDASVEAHPGEDGGTMGLAAGMIPGGLYARRKIHDWESVVAAGQIRSISEEMRRVYHVDPTRPELEYYRSRTELHLLIPVIDRTRATSPKP